MKLRREMPHGEEGRAGDVAVHVLARLADIDDCAVEVGGEWRAGMSVDGDTLIPPEV